MRSSLQLLWQVLSLTLALVWNERTQLFANADEQIVLEPGLDQTLNHIQYSGFTEPPSSRHVAVKKQLLKSLEDPENEEEWTVEHPRFRLFHALHSFVRYKERYSTQLDGWRENYEGLPEAQKKVFCCL